MQLVICGNDFNVFQAATTLAAWFLYFVFSLWWQLHVAQLQRKMEALRDLPLAFPPSAEACMGCDGGGFWGESPQEINMQFSCNICPIK